MKLRFLLATMVTISFFAISSLVIAEENDGAEDKYYWVCNNLPIDNFYVKGSAALPFYNKENGSDGFRGKDAKFMPFGTASFGAKINSNFSVDLEGYYREVDFKIKIANSIQKYTLTTYGGLINVVAHPSIAQIYGFQPFLGGGIGFGRKVAGNVITTTPIMSETHSTQGQSANSLIYQLFAGSDYQFNQNLSITTDIRWLHLNAVQHKFRSSLIASMKLNSIVLTFGVKYYF